MREVVDLAGAANPTALCEGGRRARKQPSKGHTLAELAPHVKLELENYLEDTSSVYYSPPQNFSTVFGSLAPAKGAGAADLGQTHTDARVRAWRLGSPYASIASRVHMPAALSPPHAHTSHVLLLRG